MKTKKHKRLSQYEKDVKNAANIVAKQLSEVIDNDILRKLKI